MLEHLNFIDDDVETLTHKRASNNAERIGRSEGWGSTEAGLGVAKRYINETSELIASKNLPNEIKGLNAGLIALICLQTGISSVANEDTFSKTLYALGGVAELEVNAARARVADNKGFTKTVESIKRRRGTIQQRRAALRAANREASKPWTAKDRLKIGRTLLEYCLETPVFTMGGEPHALALTDEAAMYGAELQAKLIEARPYLLPLKEPPPEWSGLTTIISGYTQKFIRTHEKRTCLPKRGSCERSAQSSFTGRQHCSVSALYDQPTGS